MRNYMKLISITVGLLCCCSALDAQDDQRIPFDVRKTGDLNVIRDRSGNVQSIRLVVTSYEITLDEAAEPLNNMDGYRVRLTGTFSFDDENQRWITVKNIETIAAAKPVEEEKPAEEPAAKATEATEKPAESDKPADTADKPAESDKPAE